MSEETDTGYPDAPSYRDIAVRLVMDERDELAAKHRSAMSMLAEVQEERAAARAECDRLRGLLNEARIAEPAASASQQRRHDAQHAGPEGGR